MKTNPRKSRRAGATLIELLVVIIIMVTLLAIAVPVISPLLGSRRTRESARLVNQALNVARGKAIQTGRPAGVAFERVPGLPQACVTLTQVEVPPPYAGDFNNSTITVNGNGAIVGFPLLDSGWQGLIKPGDLIRLNNQGRLYRIWAGEPFDDFNKDGVYNSGERWIDSDYSGAYDGGLISPDGYMLDPLTTRWCISLAESTNAAAPNNPIGAFPFQIIRQPVKSGAGSVQLPEGSVVDLFASGAGKSFFAFDPSNDVNPVMVVFNPSGGVEKLYRTSFTTNLVTGAKTRDPIHFLIGRREKVPFDPGPQPGEHVDNWHDPANLWVSIEPITGSIITSENVEVDPTITNRFIGVPIARRIAAQGQTMGGR